MHNIEPFYGWLGLYSNQMDEYSPFHEIEHSEFYYDNAVYNYLAHPLWDRIESESLLVKILYVDYNEGYAIIEMLGVWNDLLDNDFKLFFENCLQWLISNGVNKFILICENILSVYVDSDDYYQATQDELEDGWMCLLRPKEHVKEDLAEYNLDEFFFWSGELDDIFWRKLKPWQLYLKVKQSMGKILPGT